VGPLVKLAQSGSNL